MQTFLPDPDFVKSAACLDNKRLGKQRVECLQILNVLTGQSKGWINHPAVLMWKGYAEALCVYGVIMCNEWVIARGYVDNCARQMVAIRATLGEGRKLPPWLGNDRFHASHRSNLLRKDPVWYGAFGWTEGTELEYVWPSKEGMM